MAQNKTKEVTHSVSVFLDSLTDETRKAQCIKLAEKFEEWTGYPPVMWGKDMVGFGKYHYKYESGREGDWMMVGFSPRKQNLSIYIIAGFEHFPEIMDGLGKYKTGTSCLYVKALEDIDLNKLELLVKSSCQFLKQKFND